MRHRRPNTRLWSVEMMAIVSLVMGVGLHGDSVSFAWDAHTPVRIAQMQHEMKQEKQQEKHEMKMEMPTEGIFEGVGEVQALLPERSQIVVKHEEIKGFMEAMTMWFPVDPELMKDLKPGDRIKFKIDAAKKKLVAIERLEEKKGSGY
ncbi:MAG: copper-binding protein [Candidatus Rokubacteria bacterium]|nr:copper-binding protein [Candidatus Rokubacteria bacterium]